MTDVTNGQGPAPAELSAADEQVLRKLAERARSGGLKLTGEGGLLGKPTKMVVEGALEGELDDHLGYGKQGPAGRNGSNSRNGHRPKTGAPASSRNAWWTVGARVDPRLRAGHHRGRQCSRAHGVSAGVRSAMQAPGSARRR